MVQGGRRAPVEVDEDVRLAVVDPRRGLVERERRDVVQPASASLPHAPAPAPALSLERR
jgi:hypothetical protein